MVTFLAGGTGTPKLLEGAADIWDPTDITVVGNTGDDVELGGLFVCPDIDTVLFDRGGVLDRDRWWGIEGDTTETHEEIHSLARDVGVEIGPRYLPDEAQTTGRELARWRRFSGVGEFMQIGDRDRAVHITRTGLLDEGYSLVEVTQTLTEAFDLSIDLIPMSNDPVATIIHTDEGSMHFQEFWVARGGEPSVSDVEFRGVPPAEPAPATLTALEKPVVIGPSNPVTSIGPMLALPGFRTALEDVPVVVVSPFVDDQVFSGPAADLMTGIGYDPSTSGVAERYPFADAFVLDSDDPTDLDRAVVRTDTSIDGPADATRVCATIRDALDGIA